MQTQFKKFGIAWLTLSLILLFHIIDEAVNNFLPLYNQTISKIRANTGFPFPIFAFPGWLTGLIMVDLLLLFLSIYAFKSKRIVIFLAYPFAVIMFLNGCGHVAGSFYFHEWVPGVITAPLLLYGSVNLFLKTLKSRIRRVT